MAFAPGPVRCNAKEYHIPFVSGSHIERQKSKKGVCFIKILYFINVFFSTSGYCNIDRRQELTGIIRSQNYFFIPGRFYHHRPVFPGGIKIIGPMIVFLNLP